MCSFFSHLHFWVVCIFESSSFLSRLHFWESSNYRLGCLDKDYLFEFCVDTDQQTQYQHQDGLWQNDENDCYSNLKAYKDRKYVRDWKEYCFIVLTYSYCYVIIQIRYFDLQERCANVIFSQNQDVGPCRAIPLEWLTKVARESSERGRNCSNGM